MKKILLSLLLMLVSATAATASPVLRFTHLQHDFQNVSQEATVEHVFDLSNDGDKELVIEKMVPT